jgi:hypothetical protein
LHLPHDHLEAGWLPFIWPQAIVPTILLLIIKLVFLLYCVKMYQLLSGKKIARNLPYSTLWYKWRTQTLLISLPHEIHIYIHKKYILQSRSSCDAGNKKVATQYGTQ